jgi:hypothetical protein
LNAIFANQTIDGYVANHSAMRRFLLPHPVAFALCFGNRPSYRRAQPIES